MIYHSFLDVVGEGVVSINEELFACSSSRVNASHFPISLEVLVKNG